MYSSCHLEPSVSRLYRWGLLIGPTTGYGALQGLLALGRDRLVVQEFLVFIQF